MVSEKHSVFKGWVTTHHDVGRENQTVSLKEEKGKRERGKRTDRLNSSGWRSGTSPRGMSATDRTSCSYLQPRG